MYENEKELLRCLCQQNNAARQSALENELCSLGVRYENWNNMALVVPSCKENVIVLCAHFDAVPNSYGYNDNGMALVTVIKMLGKMPEHVEVVFTNCEEMGALGADYYLGHVKKKIIGCVNLDVVGCFDQVYLDPMNCNAARQLRDCKQGHMPPSDASAFYRRGIRSVCFSSGPSDSDFCMGIRQICSTLHNNRNDNKFEMLNFEMTDKVAAEVRKAVDLMAA